MMTLDEAEEAILAGAAPAPAPAPTRRRGGAPTRGALSPVDMGERTAATERAKADADFAIDLARAYANADSALARAEAVGDTVAADAARRELRLVGRQIQLASPRIQALVAERFDVPAPPAGGDTTSFARAADAAIGRFLASGSPTLRPTADTGGGGAEQQPVASRPFDLGGRGPYLAAGAAVDALRAAERAGALGRLGRVLPAAGNVAAAARGGVFLLGRAPFTFPGLATGEAAYTGAQLAPAAARTASGIFGTGPGATEEDRTRAVEAALSAAGGFIPRVFVPDEGTRLRAADRIRRALDYIIRNVPERLLRRGVEAFR